MHTKRNKRLSIFSLCSGYLLFFSFILLIMLGYPAKGIPSVALVSAAPPEAPDVILEDNETLLPLFIAAPPYNEFIQRRPTPTLYVDESIGEDSFVVGGHGVDIVGTKSRDGLYYSDNRHNIDPEVRVRHADHARIVENDIDIGILDRRLHEDEDSLFIKDIDESFSRDISNIGLDTGGNNDIDATRFELAENSASNEALGDVGDFSSNGDGLGIGDLPGLGEGSQVYAYNFPSQGVGAGIGNPGVGAAAGFAGIGAGIGQAILNGTAVSALGGIGTSPISTSKLEATPQNDPDQDGVPSATEAELGTNPTNPDTDGDGFTDGEEIESYSNPLNSSSTPTSPGSAPLVQLGGVAGLSNGAGAGATAGLITGAVKPRLGLGVGTGRGSSSTGPYGGSARGSIDLEDLPLNGSLHIMMHVDGSGSILSTRKQLDIMKDTLLKNALLPYYNNDESLYNTRVTIVDGSGERTLQFFKEASSKPNVLAVVFQDEASPDYHLPTFNKLPQKHYSKDLFALKSSLNGHNGLYRGIMFQVDRGKTFAKSFKEMVQAAWNGEGYLEEENLKAFHRDNNRHRIQNKDGVVFSDEYHAKSDGDPQYYMDLIFKAAKRVGVDLDIYGGGLKDGVENAQK